MIKDINKNDKLVLDGNTDINKNPEYINILLEKINNFIHQKEHILKLMVLVGIQDFLVVVLLFMIIIIKVFIKEVNF